jgi:RNase H-fold protein (predicted Holliday junction resolvase)
MKLASIDVGLKRIGVAICLSGDIVMPQNAILRKNRKILKQFNPEGKTVIRKEHLLKLGFDFNYHTHSHTTSYQNTYYFCYEYGYMFLKDEKVLIINQQKYMQPSTP